MKTAPSGAPAKHAPRPRPGEPEHEESVPSVPLNGLEDDSLGAAFSGLSVGTSEGKQKEKGGVDVAADREDPGGQQDRFDEIPFDNKPSESAPSASEHPAAPSPTTTRHQATHPATSSATTTPPMAEDLGFTGMPYSTYGVVPVAPMATAVSETVASSSMYTGIQEPMPHRYAGDFYRPPTNVGPTFIPGFAAPQPGCAMPAPRFTFLSGLRGPESCRGRGRGPGRCSNKSLTCSEIKKALPGATGELVANLTQEIRDKLKPLIPPDGSPMTIGASPHRVQASHWWRD